jgi:hypothetical protein
VGLVFGYDLSEKTGMFTMETLVSACPARNMACTVPPCHCTHADHALAAGIGNMVRAHIDREEETS